MPDPRRTPISTGTLEAYWGDWVRLAKRILDADALSRELEGRGDGWDLGHAAGVADASGTDTANPFR